MPYTNAQATPRSDIAALVMQANADFNKMFIGDLILIRASLTLKIQNLTN